jgi:hypothetical protein
MNAGIAFHTFYRIKDYFMCFIQGQCADRTGLYALSAVFTEAPCFRVMTIFTIDVTSLKKDRSPVAGAVHTAERDDPIYDHLHYFSSSRIDEPMVFSGIFTPKLSVAVAPITPKVSVSGSSPLPFIDGE